MNYKRSIDKGASFFFTVVTHDRRPILSSSKTAALLMDSFAHVRASRPFTMDAFVVLPDHIHCVWTLPPDDSDFPTRWRLIKSRFARTYGDRTEERIPLSRLRKGERAIWQRRYWEHRIRDEDDYRKHVDYIHYNPVKHGHATSPARWQHSSFHEFVRRGIYPPEWGGYGVLAFGEDIGRE
jgi:putative transposase